MSGWQHREDAVDIAQRAADSPLALEIWENTKPILEEVKEVVVDPESPKFDALEGCLIRGLLTFTQTNPAVLMAVPLTDLKGFILATFCAGMAYERQQQETARMEANFDI